MNEIAVNLVNSIYFFSQVANQNSSPTKENLNKFLKLSDNFTKYLHQDWCLISDDIGTNSAHFILFFDNWNENDILTKQMQMHFLMSS